MNTANQSHDHIQPNELADRLVDTALAELIGGAAPPDLSAQIAAATSRQPAAPASTAAITPPPRTRRNRAILASLAVAATLLVGASFLLLPAVQSARERSAGVVDLSARLQNQHDPSRAFPTTLATPLETAAKPMVDGSKKIGFDAFSNLAQSTAATDGLTTVPTAAKSSDSKKLVIGQDGERGVTAQVPGRSGHETITRFAPAAQTASGAKESLAPAANSVGLRGLINDSVAATTPKFGTAPLEDYGAAPSTTQLIAEIKEFQRQGKPTEKLKKELMRRSEKSVDLSALNSEGIGPDSSGDRYTQIVENPFIKAEGGDAVSTFSIDVDTASYSNIRQFLMDMHRLPPPDAVRIEEMVNYFHYDYAPPTTDDARKTPAAPGSAGGSSDAPPFAAHVEVAGCPWNPEHRLARVAVKGREMDRTKRPQSNLVFLVDVSGSMNEPAKLPLVVYGLEQLTHELGENDHIAIVVYAGTEGLVLPSTSGSKQDTILAALRKLQAGGSTAGGAGIQLAYQIAEDNFIKGGTNRVILCTDGDFNVGVTNTADLQRLVEQKAKDTGVFLSTLGFGRGNLNDAMMVAISDHGNGNYHYIDNRTEARRVLVEQMTGTLVTIAKDVKIQVEFNPAKVAGYRLIGYEKRMLRTEDFNNDKKDAGEIGAGHTVTALYEIVPADKKVDVGTVDDLKYQKPVGRTILSVEKSANEKGQDQNTETDKIVRPTTDTSNELFTLKMRYKAPDGDTSKKLEWAITDDGKPFSAASADMKFASAVAGFGMLLRNSEHKGNLTYAATLELAQGGIGDDPHGYRKELLEMVRTAKELRHE